MVSVLMYYSRFIDTAILVEEYFSKIYYSKEQQLPYKVRIKFHSKSRKETQCAKPTIIDLHCYSK